MRSLNPSLAFDIFKGSFLRVTNSFASIRQAQKSDFDRTRMVEQPKKKKKHAKSEVEKEHGQ